MMPCCCCRHFKNLIHGSLGSILETLPSMMNAIHMVWVISRNYNTDERMVPLMERIATEIASKVSSVVQSKTIFRQPPREAMKKIAEAKLVLEKWRDSYQRVSARA